MGWLRKKAKQIGKGIKKLGKSIGKGFKKVFGGLAKAFGKLGPLGSIAMMIMMPYVPVFWTNLGTWASGLTTSANVLAKGFGYAMKGLYHAGNAVGKVYSSVTGAIKGALNFIPGGKGMGLGDRVAGFFNSANELARNTIGLPDPSSMYSEASLKYLDFKAVNPDATLKDFQKALDAGQLENTLADQGQAIMERVYKDPELQKANADKYNSIASSGERPVLEFNEATGTYEVISESDAILRRTQFEGFTIETPTSTEWIAPEVDPSKIQAAAQASYRQDLIQSGVPQTEATLKSLEDGTAITAKETFDVGEYATEKLGQTAVNKGIQHLISTDPITVSTGGSRTIGLAQDLNTSTSYGTRPQEMSLGYGTYAAPSYDRLYQSFLNMGLMTAGNNDLTSMGWFGTTPNYYGAGQQSTYDYIMGGGDFTRAIG